MMKIAAMCMVLSGCGGGCKFTPNADVSFLDRELEGVGFTFTCPVARGGQIIPEDSRK